MEEYGRPGASVEAATLGRSRQRFGAEGEVRSAAMFRSWWSDEDDVVVFHSVIVPGLRRGSGDVDHVVVSGSNVLLVDSKVWKSGRYLSVGKRVWRSGRRFDLTSSATMSMMADQVRRTFPDVQLDSMLLVHSARARRRVHVGGVGAPNGVGVVAAGTRSAERAARARLGRSAEPNRELLTWLHSFVFE